MAGLTYDSERKAAEITIDNIKKIFMKNNLIKVPDISVIVCCYNHENGLNDV